MTQSTTPNGYGLTEMVAGEPAADEQFERIDDAIAAARIGLAKATPTRSTKRLLSLFPTPNAASCGRPLPTAGKLITRPVLPRK